MRNETFTDGRWRPPGTFALLLLPGQDPIELAVPAPRLLGTTALGNDGSYALDRKRTVKSALAVTGSLDDLPGALGRRLRVRGRLDGWRARVAKTVQRPFAYPSAVSLSQSEAAFWFWM